MSEPEFEGVFDEDYLYFYETFLAERTPEEVERIVELFELEPGAEILDCPCGTGFENVRTPGLGPDSRLVIVADRG